MHVTPKQIAFAAVAAVLLAVVLFWQGAADGMDQPQLETAAESGSAPARAEAAPEMPVSAPEPVLALRGIVQGAEPLVILSDGAQSRSLAVGEHFFGYEVVEIGRAGVRLCGSDGEIWLPMASFHSDGEAAGQDNRIETR